MQDELATAITHELRAFVARVGTRRALPTTCHVGHPHGDHVRLAQLDGQLDGPLEPSLLADLVTRAVDGLLEVDGACAWVTRGGDLGTTDADAAWFAAARQGFARHGLVLPAFAVVTRTAWVDLVSGEQRLWTRVRTRRRAA
jgi:hypothetical protein